MRSVLSYCMWREGSSGPEAWKGPLTSVSPSSLCFHVLSGQEGQCVRDGLHAMPVGSGAHPFRRDCFWLQLCRRQSLPLKPSCLALFWGPSFPGTFSFPRCLYEGSHRVLHSSSPKSSEFLHQCELTRRWVCFLRHLL